MLCTILRRLMLAATLIPTCANAASVPPSGRDLGIHPPGLEENKGQIRNTAGAPAPYVHFRATTGKACIFLLDGGIAYQFNRLHRPTTGPGPGGDRSQEVTCEAMRLETFRMDMVLEGAKRDAVITTAGRSSDHVNYYTHQALGVHTYTQVTYHDVYPGIDWVVHANEQGLKYDFVVHPGADPDVIRIRFEHHERSHVDGTGRLVHESPMGRLVEEAPVSFQEGRELGTRYQLDGNRLSFVLEAYDPSRELIIDPALSWSTYYGGEGDDYGYACTVDGEGNVYLAGSTTSALSGIADGGHQTTFGGGYDAYLVKFNPAGERLWATYYGGSENDYGEDIVTDADGHVYLAGFTESPAGIAEGGHQNTLGGDRDAYLVKFDAAGTRLWGTYYGTAEVDQGFACAVDQQGHVLLAGKTASDAAIASDGQQMAYGGSMDAFLVKFDADGLRLWGTYCGGGSIDEGHGCAVDAEGNVFLSGYTDSASNIAYQGHEMVYNDDGDGFLVKYDPDGTRIWGTYYGGIFGDRGHECAVDAAGNSFLSGWTNSNLDGIYSNGHQNTYGGGTFDAFLVKFEPDGTRLWGTYYGGSGGEFARSCTVDASGNAYLCGETTSLSAIADGGIQDTFGGFEDAFLAVFDPTGERLWGTYFGSAQWDEGWSCDVDDEGTVYIAGQTIASSGIASDGHQNTFGGGVFDAFLVRIDGAISTGEGTVTVPAATPGLVLNGDQLIITAALAGQHFAITDVAGRPVREGRLLSGSQAVDLSSEPPGVYLMNVWDARRNEVFRLVKP